MSTISVTPTAVSKTFKAVAADLYTASNATNGASDIFLFPIEKADRGSFVVISNPTVVGGSAVTVKFDRGSFWAAKEITGGELTVPAGSTSVIALESAFIKKTDGKAAMTITPVTGTVSLAAIGVSVAYIEFSGTENH